MTETTHAVTVTPVRVVSSIAFPATAVGEIRRINDELRAIEESMRAIEKGIQERLQERLEQHMIPPPRPEGTEDKWVVLRGDEVILVTDSREAAMKAWYAAAAETERVYAFHPESSVRHPRRGSFRPTGLRRRATTTAPTLPDRPTD